MKTMEGIPTKFLKRNYESAAKKKQKIEIKTNTYRVFFSQDSIKVGGNEYSHNDWTNFSLKQLRDMAGLERELWVEWSGFFNKLLNLYKQEA